jgi:hypothetical protein
VITKVAHGFLAGDIVVFTTTDTLPTGLTAGTKYYVIATSLLADSFRVSATYGGSAVNTSSAGSGTHTVTPGSTRIVAITRNYFRIRDYSKTSGFANAKIGSGVHLVDLVDYRSLRSLRRAKGRYVVSSSATQVTIRGLQNEQNGFDIQTVGTDTITSNNTNVSDADTVTVGTVTYTFKTNLTEVKATDTVSTTGTPVSTRASGTLTSSSTGPGNNDTVVIGSTTYTFKTSLTGAANEVVRDGTIDTALTNLAAAVNGSAGAGTTYGTGTVANTSASAGAVTSHVLTITAISYKAATGNAVTFTKTASNLAISGSGTLASGANETVNVNGHTYIFVEALDAGVADEVLINGQDTSLTNLAAAINGTTGAGTTYGTGTVVNADVTSGAVTSHSITLTAKSTVAATGNALTLAVTGSHVSRGAATFSGGVDPVANQVHISAVNADGSLTNLSEAINGGANISVDYSTGTTANTDATASTVSAHAITLSAVEGGSQSVAVSTTAVTLTVGNASLTDAVVKIYRGTQSAVNPQLPKVNGQLRRHYKSYIEV